MCDADAGSIDTKELAATETILKVNVIVEDIETRDLIHQNIDFSILILKV